MRTIKSRRNPTTGEQFHSCPKTQGNATEGMCHQCISDMPISPEKEAARIEPLQAGYRIHCPFGEEVKAIIPSHVEDSIPQTWGTDKFTLATYPVIEPKLDGARAILLVTETGIRVFSRRNNKFGDQSEFTGNVPHIANLNLNSTGLASLAGTILDGELICQKGAVSATGNIPAGTLGATMSVVGASPEVAIKTQEQSGWCHVYLFDLPRLNNEDWTNKTWNERHQMLEHIINNLPAEAKQYLHKMPSFYEHNDFEKRRLYEKFLKEGAEGAVLKNPNATYYELRAGLKVKEDVTLDVIVTGFEYGKKGGKYEHQVGALLVSVKDAATGKLVEVVNVVPGSDEVRAMLTKRLEQQVLEHKDIADLKIVIWLQAQCWTKESRLRHPRVLEYCKDRDVPTTIDFGQITRK